MLPNRFSVPGYSALVSEARQSPSTSRRIRRRIDESPMGPLIRLSPVWPIIRKRAFHAYCLGAPRTGTTSVAKLFRRTYNSKHEPQADRLVELLARKAQGDLRKGELEKLLWKRDRLLWLEMESSHPMAAFAFELVKLFPDAKFIITIRDCYSWLVSIVDHHHKNNRNPLYPEFWKLLRDIYHEGDMGRWSPEESILQENGLYTIESYLSFWKRHYDRLLQSVPAGRRILVRTDQLSESTGRLATFLNVSEESLDKSVGPTNVAERRYGLVCEIDSDFIRDTALRICGTMMDKFFPDVTWP